MTGPWFLAVSLVALIGCSGSPAVPDFGSPDGKAIAAKLDGLVEDKGRPEKLKHYFAKGSAPGKPDDVKQFASFEYNLVGSPSVSGDSAKVTLSVRKETTGEDVGKVEWTFVKEGDSWKIKTYALP